MRFVPATLALLLILTSGVTAAFAEDMASLQARLAARRELERAKNDLRYYWQVDYPRQCRELDGAIEITRTEIENNRQLLHEYRPFTQFSIGRPFPLTVRGLETCIRVAELRLNDLLAERNALIRFHGDDFRELSAQVNAARLRVAEVDAAAEDAAQSEELPLQRR